MPPEAALAAETRAWIQKSRSDLRAAEADLAATPPVLDDVAFHAQQAAEKAMKAFLTWHRLTFRKTR
jgi:HEPN domain-containing protein